MASLAAGVFGRFFARSDALEVWILIESVPDRRMARLAQIVAYVAIGLRVGNARGSEDDGENEPETKHLQTKTLSNSVSKHIFCKFRWSQRPATLEMQLLRGR